MHLYVCVCVNEWRSAADTTLEQLNSPLLHIYLVQSLVVFIYD